MKALLCAAAALLVCGACTRDGLHGLPSSAGAPSELAFGSVKVGDHKTLALTVTNQALYNFDVSGVQVAAPFTVASRSITIPSGGSASIEVDFAPQAGQQYDQTLLLQLTASDTPTLSVRLTGAGVAAAPQTCGSSTCAASATCCGDQCVDTQTDPTHCGGCSPCAAGQTCNAGVCTSPAAGCSAATCGAGHACCGDACVDTQSDPAHCGGCTACAAGQSCLSGVCTAPAAGSCDDLTAPCPGGQKCCNHACVGVGPGGLCPCSGPGGSTVFGAGTIIIPMDACYQRGADVTSVPPDCAVANSKTVGDDSPLKAYGLVFFLLRHQVTVYMAIDPNKTAIDGVDLLLSSFITRTTAVNRYDWATNKVVPLADTSVPAISYRGAPFIIDSSQHDRVLQLFASDPDFAQFRTAANITVHVANKSFSTGVAKAITAVPSRVALLQVPASRRGDSPTDILVRYLTSAGLNFPGAGGTPAAPGQIYDVLQETDFLPDYDHSNLKAGGYKLLWSPHWEGGTSNTPAQLASIGAFVSAGNDLFAECAAIGTLEGFSTFGGYNQPGSAATRFMTPDGMTGNALSVGRSGYAGPFAFNGLTSPFAQRGDFPFQGFVGLVTDFTPGSNYYSNVVRYITATQTGTDLFTSLNLHSAGKGTVVYLSGHDYSYNGPNAGVAGITAGSRLVLNTLFSLGTNNTCQ